MLRTFGIRTPARQIIAIAILLCAAALAAGAVQFLLTRKTRDFTAIFGHRLSVEVQRRMLLQPYAWHVRHNSSEQLAAIEKVEQVSMGVVLPLVQAIGGSILGTLVIAVLLKLAPGPTLLAVIIFGAIYFVLGVAARKRLRRCSARLDEAYGRRIRIVQEGLAESAISSLRARKAVRSRISAPPMGSSPRRKRISPMSPPFQGRDRIPRNHRHRPAGTLSVAARR